MRGAPMEKLVRSELAPVRPETATVISRMRPAAPGAQRAGAGADLDGLFRSLLRRRKVVALATLAGLLLGVTLCLVSTRRYRASAQMQVLKQESALSSSRLTGGESDAADPLDFNLTLQTFIDVLNSDTLALRLFDEVHLPSTSDYRFLGAPFHSAGPSIGSTESAASLPAAERTWLLKRFRKNLQVTSIPGTRVIKVEFTHPDPEVAARVVNQLVRDFEAYNFQVHYQATLGPGDALGRELESLRKRVAEADSRAGALQSTAGNFGNADTYNVVLSRLEALNRAALDAENNRVLKEAVYQVTRTGDPELISTLAGTGLSAVQGGGLTLIQALRQQQAQVNAQYAEDRTRYGENYPKVLELEQQMASLNASIKQEVAKLGDRAKNDYLIARQQEDRTKQALDTQRVLANQANDRNIQYQMAKGEADADRQLYLSLSEKLRQVQLVSNLHSSNISVIDPALVPSTPASPRISLLLGGGLLGGFLGGLGLASLLELRDKRIRDIGEVELSSGLPLLGVIPQMLDRPTESRLSSTRTLKLDSPATSVWTDGMSPVAESYRAVRTSLLLALAGKSSANVCMVTSAMQGEGKSTTTINIASVFAKMGIRTLIVDADLRNSSVARKLGLREGNGLSEALTSGYTPEKIQRVPGMDSLDLLCAGSRPDNPSELLTSEQFGSLMNRLRTTYRFIFVDTAPCIGLTDSVALSKHVDNFIFVVRSRFTTRPALNESMRRMSQAAIPCLGVLVNAVDATSSEYTEYGGYGLYSSAAQTSETA
jgi:succinoglycan biosynthesis transport protein ExoP